MSLRNACVLLVVASVVGAVGGSMAGLAGCGDEGGGTDLGVDAVADTPGDSAVDSDTHADAGDVPADEVTKPPNGVVLLNEIFATEGPDDWIELVNPGDAAVDLSGWALTDDDPTHVYTFPAGSQLGPQAHLVMVHDAVKGFDFGLSPDDSVTLYNAKGAQADRALWPPGATLGGRSYGRIPSGSGDFTVLATPTPGEANTPNPSPTCGAGGVEVGEACDGAELGGLSCEHLGLGAGHLSCAADCRSLDWSGCGPLVGDVRINELESRGTDRIELRNTGATAVSLDGYVLADALGGVYLFGGQAQLAGGGSLVLVGGQDHTFGLGSEDALTLEDPLGKLVDTVRWTAYQAAVSYCRRPDGTGTFSACAKASFGADNP